MKALKRFQGSPLRGIALLVTGSGTAQLIPLLISPLLTRLYSPSTLGSFFAIMAFVAVAASVSSGRLEPAIASARNVKHAERLALMSLLNALFLSIIIAILFALFWPHDIGSGLSQSMIAVIIAPVIFLTTMQNTFFAFAVKTKQFGIVTRVNIVKAAVLATVQIAAGFAGFALEGLLLATLIGCLSANGALLKIVGVRALVSLRKARLWAAYMKRYKDFPLFSLPAVLTNSVTANSLMLILPYAFSAATVGQVGLANRIVGAPSRVVAGAIGQVLLQHAGEVSAKGTAGLRPLFRKWLARIALLSIPGGIALYFGIRWLFVAIFGEEWELAAQVAVVLIPLVVIRFFVSPMTSFNQLRGRNRYGLAMQVMLLIFSVIPLLIALQQGLSIFGALSVMVAGASIGYLLYLFFTYTKVPAS